MASFRITMQGARSTMVMVLINFSQNTSLEGSTHFGLTAPSRYQGIYLLCGRMSHCEISCSREAAIFALDFSNRSVFWKSPWQQRCWDDCQISRRYDHYTIQSRGLETSKKTAVRRLTTYIEALNQYWLIISGVLWHSPQGNLNENDRGI